MLCRLSGLLAICNLIEPVNLHLVFHASLCAQECIKRYWTYQISVLSFRPRNLKGSLQKQYALSRNNVNVLVT